jgi:hypothetical protein
MRNTEVGATVAPFIIRSWKRAWWWLIFGRYSLLSRSFHSVEFETNVMTAQHCLEVRETRCSRFWPFVIIYFHTTFFFLPFVAGSDESGRKRDRRVGFPPLSYCCADHSQLSHAISLKLLALLLRYLRCTGTVL